MAFSRNAKGKLSISQQLLARSRRGLGGRAALPSCSESILQLNVNKSRHLLKKNANSCSVAAAAFRRSFPVFFGSPYSSQ